MSSSTYDILIVGAGPAGSALAYALATRQSNKHHAPLRIVLIERSFSKPDRISGEFIQPSGVAALKKLGLESCLESIDTVPLVGLYLTREEQIICAPFPEGKGGPSIEHGAFVMALRDRVRQLPSVEMIEATVTGLIEDQCTHRVIGVHASHDGGKPQTHLADLVVVADGSQSKFRTQLLGQLSYDLSPQGYYVGFPVKNLPIPSGYIMYYAVKGARTVILYEIPHQGYRAMFELRHPPPADVKVCNPV
jgi:squalene monooxygenase